MFKTHGISIHIPDHKIVRSAKLFKSQRVIKFSKQIANRKKHDINSQLINKPTAYED